MAAREKPLEKPMNFIVSQFFNIPSLSVVSEVEPSQVELPQKVTQQAERVEIIIFEVCFIFNFLFFTIILEQMQIIRIWGKEMD